VHEVTTGRDADDRWKELVMGGGQRVAAPVGRKTFIFRVTSRGRTRNSLRSIKEISAWQPGMTRLMLAC